ncbi:MAG: sigma 54-interacting transcriptional regulator [Planctomycetota bacterium]|nr:sigma 54-interacting transcriptional regulator [Planctomycetota bacterium]
MQRRPTTLGQLRESGWRSRTVKQELRDNLIARLRSGAPIFPGVIGYDETVIPQVVNAILAGHDFILLGLRGQAKTRILRGLAELLDAEIPAVEGSEIRDDPMNPAEERTRRMLEKMGDDLPITWVPRAERYREKLATPDVTIADLIGDVDPIKAATRKLTLADPEVVHYGILPRANRGIFAVNELPDLAARIQVGLLNILEEGDVQIRGFPVRLPLDVQLVFSANPEDYTNRGRIITPLRDRISSQILTHYPRTLDHALAITAQEAWLDRGAAVRVDVPEWLRQAVEEVAFRARASEFVDQNSGVSARMTISLLEVVVSNAERRALRAGRAQITARPGDLHAAIPAITGKLELVYEGEREGPQKVATALVAQALQTVFQKRFPDAYRDGETGGEAGSSFKPVLRHFSGGRTVDLSDDLNDEDLFTRLAEVPGLEEVATKHLGTHTPGEIAAGMELVLEGLAASSLLSREQTATGRAFKDMFEEMVKGLKKPNEKPGDGPRRPNKGK